MKSESKIDETRKGLPDPRSTKSLRILFSKKLGFSKHNVHSDAIPSAEKRIVKAEDNADRTDGTTAREQEVTQAREPPAVFEESESELDSALEKEISDLNDKGNEFFQKGEYDAALRMYSEALKMLKDAGGENEGDNISKGMRRFRTARILVNIGAVHIRRVNYDDALSALELSMRSSKLVPANSIHYYRSCEVMADALENIGLVHFKKKEFEKSSDVYIDALEARRHCMELLSARFDKAKISKSKDDLKKHIEETNMCKLDLANTLFYMCLLRERQGGIQQAIHSCEESIKLIREVHKNLPTDSSTLNLLTTISRLYCNDGIKRYQDALRYFHEVHRMKCEMLGRNHLEVASTLNNIAYLQMQLGECKKCIETSNRSIDVASNGRGLNKETCAAWTNKGDAYEKLGDRRNALASYKKALEVQKVFLGENNILNAELYEKMAGIYFKRKDLENAISLLEDSLEVKCKALGSEKSDVASTFIKLAEYYEEDHDYSNSIRCHTKALRIFKHNDDKEGAAKEHNKIGGILKSVGDYNKSMEHYMQALRYSREAKLPSNDPIVADTIRNVASFQKR
ncbi:hypothetical protein ACHAXS_002939 [Conticribra weissflogii]